MIDVQKVNATKEQILVSIRTSGPSFPTRISRETGISPLFIGALLSEMVAEQKLVMSHMKVGSTPLYYIKGHEHSLENFLQYLNAKEREAVERLKTASVLDDAEQEPAIRIALRKIKDFAIPLNIRVDDQEKLYWRHFKTPEEQAVQQITQILSKAEKKKAEKPRENKPEAIESESVPIKTEKRPEFPKEIKQETLSKIPQEKKEKKKVEKKLSTFITNIKDYLASKNVEILSDIMIKTKEFHARVRIDTPLGKQEFLLIAKDKKKITEDDLALALHKAQTEKMPSWLLARGDVDKEAKPYLEQWRNLIKFEKLKI